VALAHRPVGVHRRRRRPVLRGRRRGGSPGVLHPVADTAVRVSVTGVLGRQPVRPLQPVAEPLDVARQTDRRVPAPAVGRRVFPQLVQTVQQAPGALDQPGVATAPRSSVAVRRGAVFRKTAAAAAAAAAADADARAVRSVPPR